MIKALIKKQFLEISQFYFQDRKTGKRRSKSGVILFIALYVFVFISLGMSFFALSQVMADTFIPLGYNWLYFAIMSAIAMFVGIFGGVFTTYTTLYKAKDNDLLLSLPIKPSAILITRLIGIYTLGVIYEAAVFLPAAIVFWIKVPATLLRIVFPLLLLLISGVFVLALVCILGYLVALLSAHITKGKNIVTVVASLGFFAAYYLVYYKMNDLLKSAAQNTDLLERTFRTAFYPLYKMGLAADGDVISFVFFTAGVAVFFGIVFAVLSRSFIKIATTNRAGKKAEFKVSTIKTSSLGNALFKKELKRFTSSPNYMLNCGLGALFLLVAGVAALVKAETLRTTFSEIAAEVPMLLQLLPVLTVTAICFMESTGNITAASVSLEGKSLWILKSLPVEINDVFLAKQKLQLAVFAVPAAICAVCLGIAMQFDSTTIIYSAILAFSIESLLSAFGLFLNLKKPNFTWTNEATVIKQSAAVGISMFSGWGLGIAFFAVYYPLKDLVSVNTYLLALIIITVFANRYINSWLKTKGVEIFKSL